MNIEQISEVAWSHGWVFGKYTQQVMIDDDLLKVLDNSKSAIVAYNDSFREGFLAGLAEARRGD